MPCLAIFVSHFALNWGNYLFLTELPTLVKQLINLSTYLYRRFNLYSNLLNFKLHESGP